jgi:hypothetical protein
MKPGKPLTFATVEIGEGTGARRMLVFGLPGELTSSHMVTPAASDARADISHAPRSRLMKFTLVSCAGREPREQSGNIPFGVRSCYPEDVGLEGPLTAPGPCQVEQAAQARPTEAGVSSVRVRPLTILNAVPGSLLYSLTALDSAQQCRVPLPIVADPFRIIYELQ